MKKIAGLYSLLQELKSSLFLSENTSANIVGAGDSLLFLFLKAFVKSEDFPSQCFLIYPHQKDVFLAFEKIKFLFQDSGEDVSICELPYYLVWGPEKYSSHFQTRFEKLSTLYQLLSGKHKKTIVLTSLQGLSQFTLEQKEFVASFKKIKLDSVLDHDAFLEELEYLGYKASLKVEEKGYYSLRGGIIDIFPIQESNPIRVEMMDDKIQSLRYFSMDTQRSLENLEEFTLIPCTEILIRKSDKKSKAQILYNVLIEENVDPSETNALMESFDNDERTPTLDALNFSLLEKKQSGLDYFRSDSFALFPQAIERSIQSLKEFHEEISGLYAKDQELRHAVTDPSHVFQNPLDFLSRVSQLKKLEFANPLQKEDSIQLVWQSNLNFKPFKNLDKKQVLLSLDFFKNLLEEYQSAVLFCESKEHYERAKDIFQRAFKDKVQIDVDALSQMFSGVIKEGKIYIERGYLPGVVKDEERNVLLIPSSECFGGRSKNTLPANKKLKNILSSFRDLSVNDLVVHIDHGIGRYKGMEVLSFPDYRGDFILIEYRNNDKIYLPVDRLNLLQKYKKDEAGTLPVLDRLGTDSFVLRKAKALKSVEDLADELIKIHAERKLLRGHSFSSPSEMFERFVEDFPYQETPDQLQCLEDLEADFKGAHPMDRIIVGDVGFGKTEIALRAAFRTVLEGFQVMFLVPTTVLCYQHYHNFALRLEKYGVKIAQIHRLIKRSEQKQALVDFENGKLDFLIGTHRILSQDVKPKNLGLLIVDEEQRFGVMQKEKFKKIRANIDILSLSATPIPRTLNMAMIGLREISLVITPPPNRLPVKTMVAEYDERLVKGAIEAELMRGGQVFYVHNHVGSLGEIARNLSSLVPFAKIRTAHGQMHEESLDSIVIDFVEQKFNVLICTTIIESGVDMPNVNTLIVEHAENFGLAQLHQLRGRVGRSSTQAYAFLLTKKAEALSDEGMKRLELLMMHQELGAGFQLANYDLELRGAGNLIGRQQSGQIAGVGLELYMDMLEEKVKELSSVKTDKKYDPEIRIKVTAVIPTFYVGDDKQRLDIYKRFFSANTMEEIYDLKQETIDRYGAAPTEFEVLFYVAILRLHLRNLNAESIQELDKNLCEIRLREPRGKKIEVHLGSRALNLSDKVRMEVLLSNIEKLKSGKK